MFLNYSIDNVRKWNPNKYTIKKYLASGSFGTVFEGYDNVEKISVALKSIILEGKVGYKAAYRELCILHHVKSYYLLRLIDSKTSLKDGSINMMWLVLPFMDYDLHSIIYIKQLAFCFIDIIKVIFQILKGLQYLYDAQIIHRDLKPSNIGINRNCDIKILDFGMSRERENDMTKNVTTPYYRAIEVFYESHYTAAIDMWSTGCIFAELFRKNVLFKGKKIFDQVKEIIRITGMPQEKIYPELEIFKNIAPKVNQLRNHIEKDINGCYQDDNTKNDEGAENVIQLICWMLELNPDKRPKPHEALNSALFTKYYDVIRHYPNDKKAKPFRCSCSEDTLEYFKDKIEDEIDREYDVEC